MANFTKISSQLYFQTSTTHITFQNHKWQVKFKALSHPTTHSISANFPVAPLNEIYSPVSLNFHTLPRPLISSRGANFPAISSWSFSSILAGLWFAHQFTFRLSSCPFSSGEPFSDNRFVIWWLFPEKKEKKLDKVPPPPEIPNCVDEHKYWSVFLFYHSFP